MRDGESQILVNALDVSIWKFYCRFTALNSITLSGLLKGIPWRLMEITVLFGRNLAVQDRHESTIEQMTAQWVTSFLRVNPRGEGYVNPGADPTLITQGARISLVLSLG